MVFQRPVLFMYTSFHSILLMNKENCALKLVDEIILYYDARSKKHHIPCPVTVLCFSRTRDQQLATRRTNVTLNTNVNPNRDFSTEHCLIS